MISKRDSSEEQHIVALDFTMSEISLILVLYIKTNKTLNDMAKIQIKSKKLAPFGGILSFMELFNALLDQTIDFTLGLRCTLYGY